MRTTLWLCVALAGLTTGCVSKKKWQTEVRARENCVREKATLDSAYYDALEQLQHLQVALGEQQGAVRALEGVVRDRNQRIEALLQQIERLKDDMAAQRKMMDLTLQRQLEALAEKEAAIDQLRQEIAARNAQLQSIAAELRDTLERSGLMSEVYIQGHEAVVRIPADALFVKNGTKVHEEGLARIQLVGEVLAHYPRFVIGIEVHHDNQPVRSPRWADSWELTHWRALTIARLLADEAGIPPGKLLPIGRGEFVPVESNETKSGRAHNRRVELHLWLQTDALIEQIKSLGQ